MQIREVMRLNGETKSKLSTVSDFFFYLISPLCELTSGSVKPTGWR